MALPHNDFSFTGKRLPGEFVQGRLWIERIHVAHAAAHEQRDHAFRARRKVWLLNRLGARNGAAIPGKEVLLVEQGHQAEPRDAAARIE
jgi:hypothetical protein